jgi:hypothetical protein
VRLEIVSFVSQCTKLIYLGEGGYEKRAVRVDDVFQDHREQQSAAKRARSYAGDIMETVREAYVNTPPVAMESRNHRADKKRTFPSRTHEVLEQVKIPISHR